MSLLATLLWPFLAASLVLGGAIGWLAGLPRTGPTLRGALALASAACLSGGLAVSGVVPGRAGLWVEGGSLALGAYLIGAGLVALISDRITSDRTGVRP